MYLKRHGKRLSTRTRLAIGQLSFAVGMTGIMLNRFYLSGIADFTQGLIHGFCGALIGISIVFNLSTLPRVRKRFNLAD